MSSRTLSRSTRTMDPFSLRKQSQTMTSNSLTSHLINPNSLTLRKRTFIIDLVTRSASTSLPITRWHLKFQVSFSKKLRQSYSRIMVTNKISITTPQNTMRTQTTTICSGKALLITRKSLMKSKMSQMKICAPWIIYIALRTSMRTTFCPRWCPSHTNTFQESSPARTEKPVKARCSKIRSDAHPM